jgi:hypothetical protein
MVSSPEFIYQLRVELLGLRPAIWWQILVRGSVELSRLHVILLMTMGWDGGRMHEYIIGDTNYGEVDPVFRPDVPDDPPLLYEDKVTLAAALGDRKSFTYIYDFGDNWQQRVKVEKSCRLIPTYARRPAFWPAATPVRPKTSVVDPGTLNS